MNRENPASIVLEELSDIMREPTAQTPKGPPPQRKKPPRLNAPTDDEAKQQPTVYSAEDLDFVIGDVEWLWDSWLPKGLLTILVAKPGIGKSLLALYLTKVISQALTWPDGSAFHGQPGKAVWAETESCQALLKQRVGRLAIHKAAVLLPLKPLDDVNLGNTAHREAIARVASQPEVNLIVLDSLRGSHRQDENSSGLVNIMTWLSQLARDTGKALLVVHHLRKQNQFETSHATLDRMRGSTVIGQFARCVWALEQVRGSDVLRLSCLKSNLCLRPQPIGMLIDEDGVPQFTLDIEEGRAYETAIATVSDWLKALLVARGELKCQIIRKSCEDAGHSWRACQRAATRLDVVKKKQGRETTWRLTETDSCHPRTLV